MKKIVAIFFLISYSSVGLGIAISYHYCGGSLTKISVLNFGGHSDCSCNGKDMPMDCCKDQLHHAKADNHKTVQQAAAQNVISFTLQLPPIKTYTDDLSDSNNLNNYSSSLSHKRSWSPPIFLLNRVFRI